MQEMVRVLEAVADRYEFHEFKDDLGRDRALVLARCVEDGRWYGHSVFVRDFQDADESQPFSSAIYGVLVDMGYGGCLQTMIDHEGHGVFVRRPSNRGYAQKPPLAVFGKLGPVLAL